METTDEETIITKYTINDRLLYYRTDEYSSQRLCLLKTPFRDIVIHDNHDLAIARYPGYTKTYAKIARSYYQLNISTDIRKYVQQCDACQRTKASNQLLAGILQSLLILSRSQDSIRIDFLGPLPKSKTSKDMILVVIDRLTKIAHFIPIQSTVTSKEIADLFLQNIFRQYSLPLTIISDRDPRFIAKFQTALQEALGIKLLISIADYLQTDGQSEAAVKIIQKLLRPFVY